VTTVAASHLGLKRYDRAKVDGLRMTSDQIDKVIRDYLSLGPDGRGGGHFAGVDAAVAHGSVVSRRSWPA